QIINNLVNNSSDKIIIVDRYIHKKRGLKTLKILFEALSQQNKEDIKILVVISTLESCSESHLEKDLNNICMKNGYNIDFKVKAIGDEHDRYLISEIGGYCVGWGFDTCPHDETRVTVLDELGHNEWWSKYATLI
ncbi:MAG: hypothetical protein P8N58_03505, partial [Emcibacteraceae bacterium]|nr:hypothetical protein [Emcibacteraceae bacterium]